MDAGAESPICRICFDGAEAGLLVEPCRCSGTQAHVHEACLLRWRRLQLLQGKQAAASQCGICNQKYTANLEKPKRPLRALVAEFASVLLDTLVGLLFCTITSPSALGSPLAVLLLVIGGLTCFACGWLRGLCLFTAFLVCFTLFLYTNGMKLSVLGEPGRYIVALTSFGAPVDGLQKGMLLVSIGARGIFAETVLYVLEHSDTSTLAVILNKPVRKKEGGRGSTVTLSIRAGGPLHERLYCLHNIEGAPGAERLLPGQPVFLNRSLDFLSSEERQQADAAVVVVKGFASWGPHQLEGEVRRGAWGWIKPEDVRAEDVLEMDHPRLGRIWQRLLNSPQLQIFEG